jgi:hypothetical protein
MRNSWIAALFVVSLSAQTARFPAAIATDRDLTVQKDRGQSTLTGAVTASATSFTVVTGSKFVANQIVTIDNEQILTCSVVGNTVSVGYSACPNVDGRGYAGTTAASHANSSLVSGNVVSWNHNAVRAEVLALQQNQGIGSVVMRHSGYTWKVLKPDGTLLDISGSTSQGLQEAINYAQQNAAPLVVWGGGITPPSHGSAVYSGITTTATISFPTGWNNQYQFHNLNLYCFTGSADCIRYDSTDLTEVDWHNSQIMYSGTGAAMRWLPVHDNGEGFAGFTTSSFRFGTLVCVVSDVNLAPDPSKGTGVRISAPYLALGLGFGNGIFVDNRLTGQEINGCATGFQIDDPGGTGGTDIDGNKIDIAVIHNQGTIGATFGTSTAAAGNFVQNNYRMKIAGGAMALGVSIYGGGSGTAGGDVYDLAIAGPTTCLTLQTSATGNLIRSGYLGCTTKVSNLATAQSNRLTFPGVPTRATTTCGSSPCVFQNTTLQPMSVFVSGASITAIALSADGSTYDSASSPAANSYYFLLPGMFIKTTYSAGSVFLFEYY